MVDANRIREGLIARGLPPYVADGFVMNMRDESGLNPGINEVSPTVPGSRGGFGLYQLTGPRRTSYEQFASQRGVDPANVDAQLDFLVQELQGPERRAAQSIFAAQDAPSAAIAIARDFLRPAPEHLSRRMARYAGQTPESGGPMTPMQSQPEQDRPRGLRGLLSNPDLFDRLAIGLGGMTLNPNTALMQMSADRIAGRREERQTTESRNRTVEWLRSQPGGERFVQLVDAIGPVGALQAYQSEQSGTNLPSEIQSLTTQAQLAGLEPGTPEFQEFMLAGGGDPAAFRALDRQARAAGFEPGTPEYQEFMATRGAGLSEAAVLGARTDLGGAAAGAVAAGEEQIKRAFEAYDQASQAGRSISTMNEAIAAIDNGARSGLIENFLPNVTEASAALNNAMNRMGLDVISAVTFGALSEAEMRLAMETAAPRNLEPAALRQWLVEKRDAQAKAQEALLNAARYLSDPRNNIRDWIEMQSQRESPSAPPATPPAAPSGQRFRFNSEINDFEAAQ